MIVCKYWIAQSTPPSNLSATAKFLQELVDQRAMIIDRAHSAKNVSKLHQVLESNQCSEEKDSGDSSRDDCILNLTFESFSNDSPCKSDCHCDFSAERDHKCGRVCVTRKDAQIQTSSRTSGWRRKMRERSQTASEEILRYKRDNGESSLRPFQESEMFADFRAGLHRSNGRSHVEKSRRSVRLLENKRAEYINKFKAVNRQIEEITAALRETCCDDKHSRNNPEDDEKYSSLTCDDTQIRAKRKFHEDECEEVFPKESTPKERESENIERIVAQSEYGPRRNVQEISRIDCVNDESPLRRNFVGFPMSHYKNSGVFRDLVGAFTIDEIVHTANKTSDSEKRAKRRVVKQISFDLDFMKNQDQTEGFSIEDETFNEIYLRDDFGITNGDEYAKISAKISVEDFDDSEGLRSRKVAEEKMGERAVLVDIKRRIDRDFDDPSAEKCENDVEDFLTVSQKSSNVENNRQFYDTTRITIPDGMIEESRSTPLLYRSPSDAVDILIRDSTSAGAVSEHSNRNSTLSKYFSCTQFSSLISLTENEDEFAFNAFENQDQIARNVPHANSDSNYYDLDLISNISHSNAEPSVPYSRSRSNDDDANFNNTDFNLRHTTRPISDPSARYKSTDKLLFEPIHEPSNIFETFENGDSKSKLCDHEYLLKDDNEAKESRVELGKRYMADSTFDSTSKSSRYIGSIDSGVFVNSSLIDFYPRESFSNEPRVKKKMRNARGFSESSSDCSLDGSCTDDTLDRKVDYVVRDLTKNLILCERRARTKLEEMQKSFRAKKASHSQHIQSRTFKLDRDLHDAYYDLFNYTGRSSEDDERILSISTPSLLSLSSDSEIDERELRYQLR